MNLFRRSTDVDALAAARAAIDGVKKEIAAVAGAPAPMEDQVARLRASIAKSAAEFEGRLSLGGFRASSRRHQDTSLGRVLGRGYGDRYAVLDERALAFFFPDLLFERLRPRLDDLAAGRPAGLPAAERATRLEALARQLFEAEVAEEEIVCRIEAAGGAVERRADLDCRAFFGLPYEAPRLKNDYPMRAAIAGPDGSASVFG